MNRLRFGKVFFKKTIVGYDFVRKERRLDCKTFQKVNLQRRKRFVSFQNLFLPDRLMCQKSRFERDDPKNISLNSQTGKTHQSASPQALGLYLKHASTPVGEQVTRARNVLGCHPDATSIGINHGCGVVAPATRATHSGKAGVSGDA
jgi:hypothetical protein